MNKYSWVWSRGVMGLALFCTCHRPPAQAISPHVVISQVYGGGGNSGATFTHDFVELFNRGTTTVSLTGWSIQYTSATGTSHLGSSTTLITPLSGSIAPGHYLLLQEASTAVVGAVLPTPDVTDDSPINLSGTAGKVALVNTTSRLDCNGGSTLCSAAQLAQIVDLVGYGNANFVEGSGAAPTLSNTTAALRAGGGCTDTDNNGADFTAGTPTPRHSMTPAQPCLADIPPLVSSTDPGNGASNVSVHAELQVTLSEPVMLSAAAFALTCGGSPLAFTLSGGPQTYLLTPQGPLPAATACTLTVLANGVTDLDGTPDHLPADVVLAFSTETPFQCGAPATLIHAVQGVGATSPISGHVVDIEGIVVGNFQGSTRLHGFFVQEDQIEWDNDPTTSEGIFVFDSNFGVTVQLGDQVRVRGSVAEFGPAGATSTELTAVTNVLVCSAGHSFPRLTITLPVVSLSDWERYEGMAVHINQRLTVTGNFTLGSFGEVDLAVDRLPTPTNVVGPGAAAIALQDLHDRSRILLDDGSTRARQDLNPNPYPENGGLLAGNANRTVRAGDRVNDVIPLAGVLDQAFGAYRLQPTGPVLFNPPDNPRTTAPAPVGGRIRVAGLNVLNYFTTIDNGQPLCGPNGGLDCRGANSVQELTRQRDKIVSALAAIDAHIVGLTELENNATASLQDLVSALNAATVPGRYAFIHTGSIGSDAIKVGFLYQPAVVSPSGAHAILDSRVDPRAITTLNRPALAQTFVPHGPRADQQRFTVVINHFKSKGSACTTAQQPGELRDPDTSDGQGNCNLTRVSMASALIDWLATNPTADPTAAAERKILIMGDLNAYAREHPIQAMTDPAFTLPPVVPFPNARATYTNLIARYLGDAAYSFVFQGQSGYLDHALANPRLARLVTGVTEWHINADEPVALDYNLEWTASIQKTAHQQVALYAPDPYRASDHDPLVVGVNPLCGDFDDDGSVEAADGRRLLGRLGQKATGAGDRMDDDGDGRITLRDYLRWYQCFRHF